MSYPHAVLCVLFLTIRPFKIEMSRFYGHTLAMFGNVVKYSRYFERQLTADLVFPGNIHVAIDFVFFATYDSICVKKGMVTNYWAGGLQNGRGGGHRKSFSLAERGAEQVLG